MSGGFGDLGIMPEILTAIDEMGWGLPRDVQDETIPLMLGGGDVMVAAETGSGKTGAFGIPVLQLVSEMRRATSSGVVRSTIAAPVASSSAKLDVNDRTPFVAVAPDGLMCQARDAVQWGGIRGSVGISGGKYYFECSMRDEGLCRVGWSTARASLDLGTDINGFGFGGTGKKSNMKRFDSYGEAYGNGDVIGCILDFDGRQLSFSKNGVNLGVAFELPATQAPLFPAFCMKNGELSVNFGSVPFVHLPAGFKGVQDAASDVSVRKPSDPIVASASGGPDPGAPLAIIIEPTRELALQTAEVLNQLKQYMIEPALRVVLLMGGMDSRDSVADLRRGCDVVVVTPGLMRDLVNSGKLNMSAVRIFVIDEADRMTDAENLGIVMDAFTKIPKGATALDARLQVCLFSATLHSPEIGKLSERICQHPTWVDLKGKDAVPETVFHLIIPIDPAVDMSWIGVSGVPVDGVHASDRIRPTRGGGTFSELELSQGVKLLKPAMLVSLVDTLKMDQCLIFCRTNVDCDNLEKYLTALGGGRGFTGKMEKGKENKYSCCVLAGFRSMQERLASLKAFHDGDVRFLICTDLAARGLDIKGLPFVVNMTLPDEPENYIHRIGRVGRADRLGLALSFVSTVKEKVWYHKCKDRGRGCTNTQLLDRGGCTIWYNEPQMLEAIEKRLGTKIESMPPKTTPDGKYAYELPSWASGLSFGEDKVAPESTSEHIAAITPSVTALAELEKQSQLLYLSLKSRFHVSAGKK